MGSMVDDMEALSDLLEESAELSGERNGLEVPLSSSQDALSLNVFVWQPEQAPFTGSQARLGPGDIGPKAIKPAKKVSLSLPRDVVNPAL